MLGRMARCTPRTKQDTRIKERSQERLETSVFEAIDALFAWLKKDAKPRALVIHQGTAWVADPETRDYRLFAQKHPDATVGTYNRDASRTQVIEDVKEIAPALVAVLG